ncbi:substance-K receptor-like [Palaemon carinicauda]|uniref:substance-K receptor-like n=1 Tax=Palaemon carinicauda TaxID=392227 RepID=UPI0035B58986
MEMTALTTASLVTTLVPPTVYPDFSSEMSGDYMNDSMIDNSSCHTVFDLSDFEYPYREETWIPITWREILKITAYALVFLVSLSGNLLVILVVYYNAHMRSSTNQYLVNLAVADLFVTLVCMWVHIVRHLSHPNYVLPAIVCKLDGFVQTTALLASVLTLTVISVGRFIAVMYPLHARTSPDRAHKVIAAVWLTSAILACPTLFYRELYSIQWANFTSWQCDEIWPQKRERDPLTGFCHVVYDTKHYFYTTLTIALYFLPVGVMFINYSLVVWRLWVTKLPGEDNQPARNTATRAKRKVVKMVSIVLVVFVLCWTPMQSILLYSNYIHTQHNSLPEWFPALEFSAYFVAHSNSALNPIIYCGFNDNFRKGLVALLTCSRTYYGSMTHYRRSTTRFTLGHDRVDTQGPWRGGGGGAGGVTGGTRDTMMGCSGPEPAVLLEFTSLKKNSRFIQKHPMNQSLSGRMVASTANRDPNHHIVNNYAADLVCKKCRENQHAETQLGHVCTPLPPTNPHPHHHNSTQRYLPKKDSFGGNSAGSGGSRGSSMVENGGCIVSTSHGVTGARPALASSRNNLKKILTKSSISSFSSDSGGSGCSCCRRKRKRGKSNLSPSPKQNNELFDIMKAEAYTSSRGDML